MYRETHTKICDPDASAKCAIMFNSKLKYEIYTYNKHDQEQALNLIICHECKKIISVFI